MEQRTGKKAVNSVRSALKILGANLCKIRDKMERFGVKIHFLRVFSPLNEVVTASVY